MQSFVIPFKFLKKNQNKETPHCKLVEFLQFRVNLLEKIPSPSTIFQLQNFPVMAGKDPDVLHMSITAWKHGNFTEMVMLAGISLSSGKTNCSLDQQEVQTKVQYPK